MEKLTPEEFSARYGIPAPKPPEAEKETPLANRIATGLGLGSAVDVFGSHLARMGIGPQTAEQGKEFIQKPTTLQTAGALGQVGSIAASAALTGGSSVAGQMAVGAGLGYLYDVGSDLAGGKNVSDSLTPGGATLAGTVVPPALRGVGKVLGAGLRSARNLIGGAGEKISGTIPEGVKQIGSELAERVPRAIERGQTALEDAATRAERLKTATPAVRQAIQSGVDDVVIDAISSADEPTKAGFKKMVEIAETPRTNLRPTERPGIVAGESVAEQYKILDKQRSAVGAQIGDAVDKLSNRGMTVDLTPEQGMMQQLLAQNGITPTRVGTLDFTGSALTPKQQALVQQLYSISTQAGRLTPRQLYNFDKVFSQLQREARFDNLDNIYFSTPEGDINAFRAFRNIFSNKLDQIAPDIAPLNKQYAQLRNLQDDIESSIVKKGGFESTRNVDPAEFAQTNLRRIFSEAQSAADYRALADKLDAFARANGYTGANPQDLAGFAERLKSIYPETVPETSFRGGITTSIKDALGKVLDVGKPDTADQQKALRALLDFNQGGIPPTTVTPETPKATPSTPLSTLEAQAKGKSLDEFLKAQGTPVYRGTLGKNLEDTSNGLKILPDATFTTTAKQTAKGYAGDAGTVHELVISPKAKFLETSPQEVTQWLRKKERELFPLSQEQKMFAEAKNGTIKLDDITKKNIEVSRQAKEEYGKWLRANGYDGYSMQRENGVEYAVINKDKIKTRSQLTDIWKKANGQ